MLLKYEEVILWHRLLKLLSIRRSEARRWPPYSVQFVIKTAAIEKAEAAANDAAEEAPLTFWQKLLRLFGLY